MTRLATDQRQSAERAPEDSGAIAADRAKKPYAPPSLERYGSLVELTQFGGSMPLDSGMGLQTT